MQIYCCGMTFVTCWNRYYNKNIKKFVFKYFLSSISLPVLCSGSSPPARRWVGIDSHNGSHLADNGVSHVASHDGSGSSNCVKVVNDNFRVGRRCSDGLVFLEVGVDALSSLQVKVLGRVEGVQQLTVKLEPNLSNLRAHFRGVDWHQYFKPLAHFQSDALWSFPQRLYFQFDPGGDILLGSHDLLLLGKSRLYFWTPSSCSLTLQQGHETIPFALLHLRNCWSASSVVV